MSATQIATLIANYPQLPVSAADKHHIQESAEQYAEYRKREPEKSLPGCAQTISLLSKRR
jgi:hypothetical protein